MNGIHQVVEQTRQMAQHYMRTMDKFEMQLTKHHAALKEEGKLIYIIQKDVMITKIVVSKIVD